MAGHDESESRSAATRRARELIIEALDLLDAYGGSQQAAAHLALALDELRQGSTVTGKKPSRE